MRGLVAQETGSLDAFAHVERRAVDVHQDLGSGRQLGGGWSILQPDVLTDRHSDGDSLDLERGARRRPGCEVPGFVEHPVVGQENLVIDPDHRTFPDEGGGVADGPEAGVTRRARRAVRGIDEPHDRCHSPGGRRQIIEDGQVVVDEPRPVDEVLGWVAGDGQLGREQHVRPQLLGSRHGVQDEIPVPGQVADRQVELGSGDAHDPETTGRSRPEGSALWDPQHSHHIDLCVVGEARCHLIGQPVLPDREEQQSVVVGPGHHQHTPGVFDELIGQHQEAVAPRFAHHRFHPLDATGTSDRLAPWTVPTGSS